MKYISRVVLKYGDPAPVRRELEDSQPIFSEKLYRGHLFAQSQLHSQYEQAFLTQRLHEKKLIKEAKVERRVKDKIKALSYSFQMERQKQKQARQRRDQLELQLHSIDLSLRQSTNSGKRFMPQAARRMRERIQCGPRNYPTQQREEKEELGIDGKRISSIQSRSTRYRPRGRPQLWQSRTIEARGYRGEQ